MYEELNKRIIDAKENLRKKQYFENKLRKSEETLYSERSRLEKLRVQLAKENSDVEKLEKVSLSGLLYAVLGKKEERLDKERGEYFTAKLRYEECRNSVKTLEEEVNYTKGALKEYEDCQRKYEQLLEIKESYILDNGGENAKKLFENSTRLADLKSDTEELEEAINAGERALNELTKVYDYLNDAEGWGRWDMLGGGLISTSSKYNAIDEANEYAIDAQAYLRIFNNELKDVDLNYDVGLDIGSFDRFADYFFDGILADWSVQSQIEDSINSVEEAIDGVSRVVGTLKARQEVTIEKLKTLKEENSRLIEAIN